MVVPARVSLVTLGVADVRRSTEFYRALGWPVSPASVEGEVTFVRTAGAVLALWGEDELAADTGASGSLGRPAFRGVALALNLATRAEVDQALAQMVAAGGSVVKPGVATPWGGYSGYAADPDGHLWEVAHNPGWPLGPDGLPVLP
ncbi:MAG TPA: VOC family protein [Jiangellales bacterium]|nr:VOC family protein [Jiangellales bacterium]